MNRTLLREMMRIRAVEERIADLYPEEEMRCPVHLCIGQEAVPAGICAHLRKDDLVLGGHRSHGHYLAKGGDLSRMLAEIYGKATGCSKGKGGSMHLVDIGAGFLGAAPIVASTIPIAVGAAFTFRMRREDRVAVAFFGDAATEEGVFHESLNFAILKNLPVVFVCENNLYSVYSPLSVRRAAGLELYSLVSGYGIPSLAGDGNDAVEVARLGLDAVERARSGGGPSFLEFSTYRWREHCGPNFDNEIGYRTEEEFLEWKDRCPIESLKDRMLASGDIDVQGLDAISEEIRNEIEAAFDFAKTSPFPKASDLMDEIHAG